MVTFQLHQVLLSVIKRHNRVWAHLIHLEEYLALREYATPINLGTKVGYICYECGLCLIDYEMDHLMPR